MTVAWNFGELDTHGGWDAWLLLTVAVVVCWVAAIVTAAALFGRAPRDGHPAPAASRTPPRPAGIPPARRRVEYSTSPTVRPATQENINNG